MLFIESKIWSISMNKIKIITDTEIKREKEREKQES